jgi:hypothetical protein
MSEYLLAGALSALGCYLIMLKLDIFKICGYHVWFDAGLSVLLVMLYQGTFSGVVVGFIAGVSLTILLWLTKGIFGYKLYQNGRWVYHIGW